MVKTPSILSVPLCINHCLYLFKNEIVKNSNEMLMLKMFTQIKLGKSEVLPICKLEFKSSGCFDVCFILCFSCLILEDISQFFCDNPFIDPPSFKQANKCRLSSMQRHHILEKNPIKQ